MQPSDIKEYFKPLAERDEADTPDKEALLRYVALLKWCDALIFVYPTWWYAMVRFMDWLEEMGTERGREQGWGGRKDGT